MLPAEHSLLQQRQVSAGVLRVPAPELAASSALPLPSNAVGPEPPRAAPALAPPQLPLPAALLAAAQGGAEDSGASGGDAASPDWLEELFAGAGATA